MLLEAPINRYGHALIIGMHRKTAVFDHSNPKWVVLSKPTSEGFAQTPLRRMAQDSLIPQHPLHGLPHQFIGKFEPFNRSIPNERKFRLYQYLLEPS